MSKSQRSLRRPKPKSRTPIAIAPVAVDGFHSFSTATIRRSAGRLQLLCARPNHWQRGQDFLLRYSDCAGAIFQNGDVVTARLPNRRIRISPDGYARNSERRRQMRDAGIMADECLASA